MPIYLNVNEANGNPTNFLGITDGETAVIAGLAAVVAALIVLGVLTGGAIVLGLLAVLAAYGFLYTINNISSAFTGVYTGLISMLEKLGSNNPFVNDIITTIIIVIIISILTYLGYYIYKNI